MRVVYYAEDGTEFETSSQCEAYEQEQKNARKNFSSRMYDGGGNEIFLNDFDKVGSIDYFDIKSKEDLQILWNELAEKYYVSMPDQVGQWYYNYEKDRWCNYDELKKDYIFMSKIFEG